MHKHCYETKAQTDNVEHISCFSIMFLWAKNSNKTNKMFRKQSLFGELQANEERES